MDSYSKGFSKREIVILIYLCLIADEITISSSAPSSVPCKVNSKEVEGALFVKKWRKRSIQEVSECKMKVGEMK